MQTSLNLKTIPLKLDHNTSRNIITRGSNQKRLSPIYKRTTIKEKVIDPAAENSYCAVRDVGSIHKSINIKGSAAISDRYISS